MSNKTNYCEGEFLPTDDLSDTLMDFPSCVSMQQLIVCELMVFAIFPELVNFIRSITEFEQMTGLADALPGTSGVLVASDPENGVKRTYLVAVPLEEVLA